MCSIIFKNNAHPQFQLVLTHVDVFSKLKNWRNVLWFPGETDQIGQKSPGNFFNDLLKVFELQRDGSTRYLLSLAQLEVVKFWTILVSMSRVLF